MTDVHTTVSFSTLSSFSSLKDLRKINVIINSSSYLNSIFLSTTLLSNILPPSTKSFLLHFLLKSSGDALSSFSSLQDATFTVNDHDTIQIKRIDSHHVKILHNDNTVARISVTKHIKILVSNDNTNTNYLPVLIPVTFNVYDIPERIISYAKRYGAKSDLEIVIDDFGIFKLHYNLHSVYTIDRQTLKQKLIDTSLSFANIILIDEIENSLPPDTLKHVIDEIVKSKAQVFLTTNSNEVIKMLPDDAVVYYVSKQGIVRRYNISEIKDFDRPLSWLGYI